jgi:hypothetical protein
MTIREYIVSTGLCDEDKLITLELVSPGGYYILLTWVRQIMEARGVPITELTSPSNVGWTDEPDSEN